MLGISHYTRKKDLSETENNSFISEKKYNTFKNSHKNCYSSGTLFSLLLKPALNRKVVKYLSFNLIFLYFTYRYILVSTKSSTDNNPVFLI